MLTKEFVQNKKKKAMEIAGEIIKNKSDLPVKSLKEYKPIHIELKNPLEISNYLEALNKIRPNLKQPEHQEILHELYAEFPFLNQKDIELVIFMFWKRALFHVLNGKVIHIKNICNIALDFKMFNIFKRYGCYLNVRTSTRMDTYSKPQLREYCVQNFGPNWMDKVISLEKFFDPSELEKVKREK